MNTIKTEEIQKEDTTDEKGLEQLLEQAFQKGKEEGENLGYQKHRAEMDAFFFLLQKLAEKVMEQKEKLLEQLKPEIIEFSLTICERVLRQELSQPQILVKLIDALLATAVQHLQDEDMKLLLSPEDLVLIQAHLHQIHYDKKEIKRLRFLSDPQIKRGDVRIETESGMLHQTIVRSLDDLRSKIFHQ